MNIKSLGFTSLVFLTNAFATELNPKFIKAIHQVESSGKLGNVIGDNGKALGPLQIHRSYFQDAVNFDPSIKTGYNSVTNLSIATRVVSAYLKRYAPIAVKQNDYKTLARIHNGGPNGNNNPNTNKYWTKVSNHIK